MQYYMYVYIYIWANKFFIWMYKIVCVHTYVGIRMYMSCTQLGWRVVFFSNCLAMVYSVLCHCASQYSFQHILHNYKVMNLVSRYFKDTNVYNNRIATVSCVYQHISPPVGVTAFFPTPQLEGGGGMATAAKGFVQPPPEVWSFFWWRLNYQQLGFSPTDCWLVFFWKYSIYIYIYT